jgi:hypothetical protein
MDLLNTNRLIIRESEFSDDAFILELLNTEAWKKYIGDRNVTDEESARNYIQRAPLKSYEENGFGLYTVLLKEERKQIGLCGFIRRANLPNPDLGFAFLPEFWRNGYAYEAAKTLLEWGFEHINTSRFHAITLPENIACISLLKKLGFNYEDNFFAEDSNVLLHLFSIEKPKNQ